MTKLVCIMCGGSNVQELAWINPNTKKYIEPFSKKKDDVRTWCNDCKNGYKLIPEKEFERTNNERTK